MLQVTVRCAENIDRKATAFGRPLQLHLLQFAALPGADSAGGSSGANITWVVIGGRP